ncbi:uncharacterized protein K02A2.6 [Lingula anatina]|uniref:Uncharacterized protein K02A2.6 n=1 Tax=Lingula anatina TaxID=7574 RepID=A0A1S3J391_LINAN|nr:uncharacterized protein K02A2.6 [Lingula anatina]|eukprot:XP_013404718.1 uncharacterized protein K02A2.6 [Lingula anatina]
MARIGRLNEFDDSKENVECYIERLEQYFLVNDIENDKKAAVLLTVIGSTAYAKLKSLTSPELPSTLSYDQLKGHLQNYYAPKPLVIAERFKFMKRNQLEGEKVSEYLSELRRLSTHCEYGDFLNQALRDRFVCGLLHEGTQKKLLATKDLTLEMAFDVAMAMELAHCHSQQFRPPIAEPANVHKVTTSNSKESNRPAVRKNKSVNKCWRCTGNHSPNDCRFKDEKCFVCSKVGHIAKVCWERGKTVNEVIEDTLENHSDILHIYSLKNNSNRKGVFVPIAIDGQIIQMQIDTAAEVSVITEDTYKKHFSHKKLGSADVRLRAYNGETIPLIGKITVNVVHEGQNLQLPLIVAKGSGKPPLLGYGWLQKLKLNWKEIFAISQPLGPNVGEELMNKYENLFSEGYGKIKEFKAHIRVKEDASPVFCKARPVPYALKPAIEAELNRLEQSGIIEKVDHSEWAAPIVVVPKSDGSVRICGDYKVTVNQAVSQEQYPLPTAKDLFSTLAGGTVFTKIDLSSAYAQLELDEESQKYLVVNTHKGLYKFKRLAYGVKSAPMIFQCVMDQMLKDFDGVICSQDDVLIKGIEEDGKHEEDIKKVEKVLQRLKEYGVKAKRVKCRFLEPKVEYLGHMVDKAGLHPTEEKVKAIRDAPVPKNVQELESFIGLVNYYGAFFKDMSTTLAPLNRLRQKNVNWKWTEECQKAFDACKCELSSDRVLTHYDSQRKIKLDCDASAYGVGAVISHIMDDGSEKPIAFASRTLSKSERNYAQIEKEALSIIFGVTKFHQYLYGRKWTLVTDHKPLLTILGPKTGVPTLAAARMQRWAIILSAYDYDIQYRKSELHSNADCLSRLPHEVSSIGSDCTIYVCEVATELPLTASDIAEATRKDSVLSKVMDYTMSGWPEYLDSEILKPYHVRRHELSAEQGCILWGNRVVIPEIYRQTLLEDLHWEHPGVCAMKAIARSYVWWPNLNSDIECKVRECSACQSVRNMPPASPLYPWKWPVRPWSRIHLDFFFKEGKTFLLVHDAHSKWLEVIPMSNTDAEHTIDELRILIASYGLPEEVVSDNGPQFSSDKFREFLKTNGIKQTLVPPYHPQSNGAAENSVKNVKRALEKHLHDVKYKNMSLKRRLANFLMRYRSTPHTTTGKTPAELFLKRQIRTRFSLLKPNLADVVEEKQMQQKRHHDKAPERCFQCHDRVRVRDMTGSKLDKWLTGSVIKVLGPRRYLVQTEKGLKHVHVDQIIPAFDQYCFSKVFSSPMVEMPVINENFGMTTRHVSDTPVPTSQVTDTGDINVEENINVEISASPGKTQVTTGDESVKISNFESRYPVRNRKPKVIVDV